MESSRAGAIVCFLTCIVFLASSPVAMARYSQSIEDTIPSSLAVPPGNVLQEVLFATGVQIYVYNGTNWVQNNVSADLYNFKGIKIGHHFYLAEVDEFGGQPTWETFHPVTRVTGRRIAGVSQPDAIDWVLLQATTTEGKKFFGLTTYIQRVYTQHGLPPAADYPAKEGDIFESNYSALYIFFAKSR